MDPFDPIAQLDNDEDSLEKRAQLLELLGARAQAVELPHVTSPENFHSHVEKTYRLVPVHTAEFREMARQRRHTRLRQPCQC